ncbi:MAG: NADH-quinone oxidoreductase subunit M [Verrucomicrobiae bacterium]|nr:NADH-quinone oxidoreductase subunit M [Verrucomicrobiae bacterium]
MTTLTLIFLLPLLAAITLAFVPRNFAVIMRAMAVGVTFVTMLLAVLMFWQFNGATADEYGYRFVSTIPGLGAESLGIACKLGVDGLNVGLVLMGAIVAFAAACCSFEIKSREKEFYILLLTMTGGILGAFMSLDLFFFYFFHELALVPTFIMIGVWGRGERKNYATFQITLYLSIGALLALIGLIALYLQVPADVRTFDIPTLTRYFADNPMAASAQNFIFPLLLFGFGILVSLWPFHSWAALGYGSAPSATAMLHAGVLKKFGLYGLIRVALPFMPEAAQSWMQILAWLCLGNILYVGWVAIRQKDLNLLIGNSSVAHMGFVFLGIASLNLIGVTGAVVIMVAHGFLAALSFGLSGYIYNQTGTLEMSALGGLAKKLRFIGVALTMAALAGCGLPGFLNFVGEVTVFFGAWQVPALRVVTVLAVWGALIIGAVYMLRAVRWVLHGPAQENATYATNAADANAWRKVPHLVLLASLLVFGFFPRLLTDKVKPVTEQIVNMATATSAQSLAENAILDRPHPGFLPQERESHSQLSANANGGDGTSGFGAKEDDQSLFPAQEPLLGARTAMSAQTTGPELPDKAVRAPGFMAAMRDFTIEATPPETFARSRRREEADNVAAQGNPPPHVGGYGSEVQSANLDSAKSLLGREVQGEGERSHSPQDNQSRLTSAATRSE